MSPPPLRKTRHFHCSVADTTRFWTRTMFASAAQTASAPVSCRGSMSFPVKRSSQPGGAAKCRRCCE